MKHAVLLACILLVTAGCKKETEADFPDNLHGFIQASEDLTLTYELIACSALLPNPTDEESNLYYVFFRPMDWSQDYRLFVTESVAVDPNDYSNYREVDVDTEPVFAGHLRRFPMEDVNKEYWAIVTYQVDDKLHICNPIRMKANSVGTELSQEVTVEGNGPTFCWPGDHPDNAIHFQVVHTTNPVMANSVLISGTYTYDTCFTFYELDNVVLNVTNPGWEPELNSGSTYNFLVMSVSEDNWVNQVYTTSFTAP